MDSDSKVMLVRMEGKLDLMNERHETVKQDLVDVKTRLHSHGNRIGSLEEDRSKRQGAVGLAKYIWALASALLVASIAIVARAMGV